MLIEKDYKMYTCLIYHEVVTPRLHKFSVEPIAFEQQVVALKKAGMISYVLGKDEGCNQTITDKFNCMLTFDDGHVSNLEAARLLSKYGFTGFFFLIKDWCLERPDYLSEKDIKEMSALGHVLGVHGKNHGQWAKMPMNVVIDHLRETKDWIEQLTGKAVNICSAPGGSINQSIVESLRQEIPELKYIRTSKYGINYESDTVLKSVGIRGVFSPEKVVKLAINDFWTMKKLMAYYYTKESIKPIYHLFKK